jgi:hypothetical protein
MNSRKFFLQQIVGALRPAVPALSSLALAVLLCSCTQNHMRIEDPKGEVLDEFDVSNPPPHGGGISFFLREGASILITELFLEPEGGGKKEK